MVNADLWMRWTARCGRRAAAATSPFGGVQVVLFGDPYQLAPVPGEGDERATSPTTTARCGSSTRRCGDEADLTIYELDDHPPPARGRLQAHAQRRAPRRRHRRDRRPAQRDGRAAASDRGRDHARHPNGIVNRINATQLAKLPGRALTARAEINGDFGGRAYPGRRRARAQGRRAGDVPAQRPGPRAGSTARSARSRRSTRPSGWMSTASATRCSPAVWEKFRYSYSAADQVAAQGCRRRVHAVPAAAGVGGHDPQVAGQDLRARDRRPRLARRSRRARPTSR